MYGSPGFDSALAISGHLTKPQRWVFGLKSLRTTDLPDCIFHLNIILAWFLKFSIYWKCTVPLLKFDKVFCTSSV